MERQTCRGEHYRRPHPSKVVYPTITHTKLSAAGFSVGINKARFSVGIFARWHYFS